MHINRPRAARYLFPTISSALAPIQSTIPSGRPLGLENSLEAIYYYKTETRASLKKPAVGKVLYNTKAFIFSCPFYRLTHTNEFITPGCLITLSDWRAHEQKTEFSSTQLRS